jgi:hypothetical protein
MKEGFSVPPQGTSDIRSIREIQPINMKTLEAAIEAATESADTLASLRDALMNELWPMADALKATLRERYPVTVARWLIRDVLAEVRTLKALPDYSEDAELAMLAAVVERGNGVAAKYVRRLLEKSKSYYRAMRFIAQGHVGTEAAEYAQEIIDEEREAASDE